MKFKHLLLAMFVLATGFNAFAQESHGGTPPSLLYKNQLSSQVPFVVMPLVDAAALLKEDSLNVGKNIPYRFGFNHMVNLNTSNSGEWTTLKKGDKVWRLGIKCPEAYSINIALDKFIIPDGAQLFVYSADRTYILGSFTSANVQSHGELGVDLVPGEETIVEYYEPANVAFKGKISISRVTHAYKDAFKAAKSFGDAGNCHNNVVCPIANGWQQQISSVIITVVNGNGFCSAAAINNTNNDGTPYVLGAYHCGTNANNWVFRFNYNSPNCTPSANGPTNQSISGATLRAGAASSDFTLFQLNQSIPLNYNVCFSGWSRSNTAPTSGAGIHHPSGDVKKFSVISTPFDSTQWTGNGVENHWFVQWSSGVTEGGSSGSPLFDQNKRIVGQLHGGASYCGAPTNSLNDEYGKLFYSWNKIGNGPTTQLKTWLDPTNTGAVTVDAYCPGQVVQPANEAEALGLVLPANSTCITSTIPGLIVTNGGTSPITSLTISWVFDGGTPQTYTWNGSIASNATDTIAMPQITFSAGAHTYTATIVTVNGSADSDNTNNSANGSFTVSSGSTYTLTLVTDDYGDETSAYIISLATGDTLLAIDPETLGNNETTTYPVCLPAGCYKLVMGDTYGDGMCCLVGDGSYTLTDPNNNVVTSAGQFGYQNVYFFCSPTPDVNAAMIDIISPEGTYCNDNKNFPQVIIANQGALPLTSVTINFVIDNGSPISYNWTGNLASGDSTTVSLDQLFLPSGAHTITFYTSNPNNTADGLTANDTLATQFTYSTGNAVLLNLVTDNYPNEIAWTLTTNPGGAVVDESETPTNYFAATTYNRTFCLPDGCYKFIITDESGDGICCDGGNGSFTLLGPANEQIGTGAQYADSDTVEFCVPLVGVYETAAPQVKVYPNPANNEFFVMVGNTVADNLIIELINSQGQLVQSASIQSSQVGRIQVVNQPSGFYMVRVYGQKTKPFTTPIIIKN